MKNKPEETVTHLQDKPAKTSNPAGLPRLSVIIVNYNVKYFLEQALFSVYRAADNLDVEIFVVDNDSVDDSVAMVEEKFPDVKLIANKENVGFSVANNQAIEKANGDYILLLNPDTVVEEDTFEKCLNFMEAHPEAGGLGVKMIDGRGKFLPESKRGFPSPFVAFSKAFGLSRLFPKSKVFNRYHLGFLSKDETHEVEVLSGAFMLMRKSVLDQVGLLDETFFMYGEDIDLSYRIIKGGNKNYYFADTTIIHYKGESTRKGSLNYVRVFYKAMIIFAKKHFRGQAAWIFIFAMQLAIYFRAGLTLFSNFLKKAWLPMVDALIIFAMMFFLKEVWANTRYNDPDYYLPMFMTFNVPLYISIWLSTLFFNGGYDEPFNIGRLIRGFAFGTLVIAAVYGFLPLDLRSSRALILLGAFGGLLSLWIMRAGLHYLRFGNMQLGALRKSNLVIVGSETESKRVQALIYQAQVQKNLIGTISPESAYNSSSFIGNIDQLDELVYIYNVNEIIFCSTDISAQSIMQWMTRLGPEKDYKIVPEKSLSIIGSNSKNTAGDLYTIDIQFSIATTMNRRNKRGLDLLTSLVLFILSPFVIFLVKGKMTFFTNIFSTLIGRKTWVGYHGEQKSNINLPKLKEGILSPLDPIRLKSVDPPTINRLNFLYAKDYNPQQDLSIIWKSVKQLGRKH
ncbi:MAG: glycosyltransferase [Bacteroidota bacterium]